MVDRQMTCCLASLPCRVRHASSPQERRIVDAAPRAQRAARVRTGERAGGRGEPPRGGGFLRAANVGASCDKVKQLHALA